jgi:hypothetical protein
MRITISIAPISPVESNLQLAVLRYTIYNRIVLDV